MVAQLLELQPLQRSTLTLVAAGKRAPTVS